MGEETKHLEDYRQMERSDFNYFFEMPTRWGDLDAFGHVNNTLYARYYESARLGYFESLMDMRFDPELSSGVIHADMKIAYIKQLHYPSDIDVGCRISRMGNSSLDLDAAIFLKGSDTLISTSRAILVWFDYKANVNKPIPEENRKMIIDYERITPA
jgi:acyl-CoA thioester hydrolase